MGVALLNLVETALRIAKQAAKPDSGGFARKAHIVATAFVRKRVTVTLRSSIV